MNPHSLALFVSGIRNIKALRRPMGHASLASAITQVPTPPDAFSVTFDPSLKSVMPCGKFCLTDGLERAQ